MIVKVVNSACITGLEGVNPLLAQALVTHQSFNRYKFLCCQHTMCKETSLCHLKIFSLDS